MRLNYDLENTPLEIKIDSEVGSNEEGLVYFFSAEDEYAGGVGIHFTSQVQYHLDGCLSWTILKTTLPSSKDKVFRITLTRTSGVRIKIHCDEVELLNVLLSDTCSQSNWGTFWNRDVEKIQFRSADTASDGYRPYTGE
jgi:hypothetical protein